MLDRQLFQIISDLHISYNEIDLDYMDVSAPYLIIAGDICSVEETVLYKTFLECLSKKYKHIFLVAGNHEYYSKTKSFEFLNTQIKSIVDSIENISFLDDTYEDLPGNIRIYGSTLWSSAENYAMHLPINSCLGTAGDKIWMNKMHYNCLYNLQQQLLESRNLGKRLIVVTHYPPTIENTVSEKHKKSCFLTFYANNLDSLLSKEYVYIWIYGHTHINSDYLTVMDTRVVSNQYRGKGWVRNKVLSVRNITE